jgi:hypothetical protein
LESIDIIHQPLDRQALSRRYAAMIDDALFARVSGRLELNAWRQIIRRGPSRRSRGSKAGR